MTLQGIITSRLLHGENGYYFILKRRDGKRIKVTTNILTYLNILADMVEIGKPLKIKTEKDKISFSHY